MACYVLGCPGTVLWTAQHTRFGAVSSCAGHNPAKHGYAVLPEIIADAEPVSADPLPGGAKVPRLPIPPRAPLPAVANPF